MRHFRWPQYLFKPDNKNSDVGEKKACFRNDISIAISTSPSAVTAAHSQADDAYILPPKRNLLGEVGKNHIFSVFSQNGRILIRLSLFAFFNLGRDTVGFSSAVVCKCAKFISV